MHNERYVTKGVAPPILKERQNTDFRISYEFDKVAQSILGNAYFCGFFTRPSVVIEMAAQAALDPSVF